MADDDLRRQLAEAQATITAQAVQLHRLEADRQQGSGSELLRELLQLSDVVGATIGESPYRTLLEGIVQAARRIFDAGAASILLLDHATNELVFEAAAEPEILGLRIPAHQGIAGWVMMTGEPIAVSDVRRDPRWNKDFAKSTGYIPQSIMAVPLIVGEDVEGVLEVLDKNSAASFGLNDMELLGLFAHPAAIAVEQARRVSGIGRLLVEEMGRRAGERGNVTVSDAARTALAEDDVTSDRTLDLARLVHRLSRRSERGQQLALDILTSVERYTG
jgi:GAF domain-containing protein